MDKRKKKRHIPIFVRMCFLIRLNYTIVKPAFFVHIAPYALAVIYILPLSPSTLVMRNSIGAKMTSSGSFCTSGIKSSLMAGVPTGAIISAKVHPPEPYIAFSAVCGFRLQEEKPKYLIILPSSRLLTKFVLIFRYNTNSDISGSKQDIIFAISAFARSMIWCLIFSLSIIGKRF